MSMHKLHLNTIYELLGLCHLWPFWLRSIRSCHTEQTIWVSLIGSDRQWFSIVMAGYGLSYPVTCWLSIHWIMDPEHASVLRNYPGLVKKASVKIPLFGFCMICLDSCWWIPDTETSSSYSASYLSVRLLRFFSSAELCVGVWYFVLYATLIFFFYRPLAFPNYISISVF